MKLYTFLIKINKLNNIENTKLKIKLEKKIYS